VSKWRKEAYAGPEWVLMSERLPERGQVVDLYDAMFNRIDQHTVTWEPDRTDGDYVMWRAAQ
jgi:hypothetical protein